MLEGYIQQEKSKPEEAEFRVPSGVGELQHRRKSRKASQEIRKGVRTRKANIWVESIPGRGHREQRPFVEPHLRVGGTVKAPRWQECSEPGGAPWQRETGEVKGA